MPNGILHIVGIDPAVDLELAGSILEAARIVVRDAALPESRRELGLEARCGVERLDRRFHVAGLEKGFAQPQRNPGLAGFEPAQCAVVLSRLFVILKPFAGQGPDPQSFQFGFAVSLDPFGGDARGLGWVSGLQGRLGVRQGSSRPLLRQRRQHQEASQRLERCAWNGSQNHSSIIIPLPGALSRGPGDGSCQTTWRG